MIIPGFPMPLAMRGGSVPYLPIPAMTSNTTPAGWEAFADSQSSIALYAWKAFDGIDNSGYWSPTNTAFPHHVGLSAPAQFVVVRYAIVSANTNSAAPSGFGLQGSNNGTSWDTIDERFGVSWTGTYQRQEWDVTTPGAYSYYRLLILGQASGQQSRVCEVIFLQEDDL
jgi:hypothetical protein